MHKFKFAALWSARKDDDEWVGPNAIIDIGAANASAAMREAIRVLTLHEREVAELKYPDGSRGSPVRGLIKIELLEIDGDKLKAEEYRALGVLA